MLDILQQDTRMIRGSVNDFARESVTAGEVEAITTTLIGRSEKLPN
jgi:hypothetical protein